MILQCNNKHYKTYPAAPVSRREFLINAGIAVSGATLSLVTSSSGCASHDTPASLTSSIPSHTEETLFNPAEILYSTDGIWINDEGSEVVRLGITEHLYRMMTHQGAQGINSLELPEPGTEITRGNTFGTIESSKMDVDLISPVSGKVLETSRDILSGNDVYKEWMLLLQLSAPQELEGLLSYDEYLDTYS
jgi:glycine cleavage system H protein